MSFICKRCPQKLLLQILSKLGEDVSELQNDGCPWHWQIKVEDTNTKQVKDLDICGIEALPRFLHDYGASNLEVSQSIQSMRNEDSKNVHRILSAVAQRMEFDQKLGSSFLKLAENQKSIAEGDFEKIKDVIGE